MTYDDSFNTQHVPLCNLEKLESYLQYHTKQFIQIQCITKRYNFKSSEASREYSRWEKSQQLSLWSSTHSWLVSRQNSESLLPRFVHVVSSFQWVLGILINFPWVSSKNAHAPSPCCSLGQTLTATEGYSKSHFSSPNSPRPWELKSRVNKNILFSYL